MRIFYLILCFICLCDLLHAQTVRISYEGDPLTDKERRKIEQTLQYEVEFYAQFGIQQKGRCAGLSEQIQYTSSQKYKRNVYIQITKGHHIKQRKRIPTRSGRHLSRTEPSPHLANHGRTSSDMVQRGTCRIF